MWTDVKIAFTWLREALLLPLPPGSRVVAARLNRALNVKKLSIEV